MLGFEKRISLEFPGGLLIKDLAYCCSSLGLIPGPAQWVKDLVLLQLWCRSQMWLRSGVAAAVVYTWQLQLQL